jgi:integrase
MGKITKRVVDALGSKPNKDVFAWDGEMRGFGVRVKPTGAKTYLIQYRNIEGRTRRLVLGSCGVLTPEQARALARQKLAAVAEGADPSADRHAIRDGMTVADVCDWYLKEAGEGRLLGRNRRPIKATSIAMDRSRIETHIKPLLGPRLVSNLTLRDVEAMQADIAAGKSARGKKAQGRGGRSTGGAGVAARAISTFRALLGHATRLGLIEKNPASGVRQMASRKVKRRLSADEVRHLGKVMRQLMANGEHPTGLGAIRLMLLTGFRRMEALSLQRAWLNRQERAIHFPDTKSGEQLRVVGGAAIQCIESQPVQEHSPYVFPADVGDGHFIGVVRVLDRVCAKAKLSGVTPHVLRHTFASIAGDLGFSELTIAGLLGHTSRGVTQRYVHLDAALAVAADQVSAEIVKLLDGESKSDPRPTSPRRKRSRASSEAADPSRSSAGDGDLRPALASS